MCDVSHLRGQRASTAASGAVSWRRATTCRGQRSLLRTAALCVVRCLLMESDKIGIVSGACWCGQQHRPRDDEAGDGLRGAMTRIIARGACGRTLSRKSGEGCLHNDTRRQREPHNSDRGPSTNRSRLCERTGSIGADIYLPRSGPLPPSSLLSWSTTSSSSSPPPFCPAAPDRREYTGDAYAELRAAVARTGEGGREEDDI